MSDLKDKSRLVSRRAILKSFGLTPLLFHAAPFSLFGVPPENSESSDPLALADVRLTPRYPLPSPLADVLRLVPPGSDEYMLELYATEIEAILRAWGLALRDSASNHSR